MRELTSLMKKIIKILGIALAVIAGGFILLVIGANAKKFLYKLSIKDCPGYISILAEYKKSQPDISILQNKINQLNIGATKVRLTQDETIEIIITDNKNDPSSIENHQKIAALLNELGLQEIKSDGTSAYQAKQCFY